jgi:hypothetical protein
MIQFGGEFLIHRGDHRENAESEKEKLSVLRGLGGKFLLGREYLLPFLIAP